MKIALTQACLKVKCYFCFSIVRQRYSRNRYYQNEVLAKVFRAPFFKKVRYCGNTMRAVLHNTAEKGEWKAAYGAHPEPYFGKEEVSVRAVDSAVDLAFRHSFGGVYISVAK